MNLQCFNFLNRIKLIYKFEKNIKSNNFKIYFKQMKFLQSTFYLTTSNLTTYLYINWDWNNNEIFLRGSVDILQEYFDELWHFEDIIKLKINENDKIYDYLNGFLVMKKIIN